MLTPEQVIAAFQNAMPGRRSAFAAEVAKARREKDHKTNMKFWYPAEVLRLAQDEARLRISIAAEKIRKLLDSGWEPTPSQTVHTVMSTMFGALDTHKHAVSDLENAVRNSVGEVAGLYPPDQPGDQKAVTLLRELSQTWLDASNEFISDLEIHIPQKGQPMSTNYNFQGNVGMVQTGGTSHVTQNFGMSAADFVNAVIAFQQEVRASGASDTADIDLVIQEVAAEAKSENPNRSKIASLVSGLSQAVQTGAAIPGAWNVFAAAVTTFTGHPVPTIPTQ